MVRAQRGDARAFEELVRAHWEVMFRVAVLVTGDAAEAEDVAQEALVKSWRALARFRVGEPVRPWLLTIVANEARNRRRSAGRRSQLVLRAAREAVSGDAAPSPEATLLTAEDALAAPGSVGGAAGAGAARARVPVPARPVRAGDGRGAGGAARDGEVAHGACTGAAEGVL